VPRASDGALARHVALERSVSSDWDSGIMRGVWCLVIPFDVANFDSLFVLEVLKRAAVVTMATQ
jgi:hypothetical protein